MDGKCLYTFKTVYIKYMKFSSLIEIIFKNITRLSISLPIFSSQSLVY